MNATLPPMRCLILSLILGATWSSRLMASVLLLGAEYNSTNGEIADVKAKIAATGLVSGTIDTLDISIAASPTVATLQQYDAVLVWSDATFSNPTTLGSNLATYVSGGGGVVQMQFAGQTGASRYGLAGTWQTGGYGVFTTNDNVIFGTELSLGTIYVPTSAVMANVHTFNGGLDSYHLNIAMTPGASRIADWSDGTPLVATRTIPHGSTPGGVVGLNFFPLSSDIYAKFWTASTDGGILMANALNFAASPSAGVAGDYNHNGTVDVADYVAWRDGLGTSYIQSDYDVGARILVCPLLVPGPHKSTYPFPSPPPPPCYCSGCWGWCGRGGIDRCSPVG